MYTKTVEIKNSLGIHARPASMIVKTASKFKSKINISKDGIEANAKSIMGLLMLACEQGSKITITADGNDEREAVEALIELINRKFDEE